MCWWPSYPSLIVGDRLWTQDIVRLQGAWTWEAPPGGECYSNMYYCILNVFLFNIPLDSYANRWQSVTNFSFDLFRKSFTSTWCLASSFSSLFGHRFFNKRRWLDKEVGFILGDKVPTTTNINL